MLVVPYRKMVPRSDSPCKYSSYQFSGYIGGRSQDLGRAGICSYCREVTVAERGINCWFGETDKQCGS